MEISKKETISLLTRYHQLLMDHQQQILKDPYLRSLKLPLRFKFGVLPPFDLRLGHLLLLWKKNPRMAGTAVRILEAEGSAFTRQHGCYWYNVETGTLEEGQWESRVYMHIFGMRDAFQKQRLSVDLNRLLLQLSLLEEYSFSEQLRHAHKQFKEGLGNIRPKIAFTHLKNIYLNMSPEGLVRIELRLPKLSFAVSSFGLVNHKAVYYQGLMEDLMESLAATTGFVLMEKTDPQRHLYFSQVVDPYAGDKLYGPEMMTNIHTLFTEYTAGMEDINNSMGIRPMSPKERNYLQL